MGGGAIGGGSIQGYPMGHRTGYGHPFKKILKKGKKLVQKLTTKRISSGYDMGCTFHGSYCRSI